MIRTPVTDQQIHFRGENLSPAELGQIKKALRALHTLELMASNIYKYQIGRDKSEHNRMLVAAMCNEMTHLQDFQVKLYEYGFRPGLFRWVFWFAGFCFGFCSRMLGKKAVLRLGIWVESKAVDHYGHLLESCKWDEQTRQVIEKDARDEAEHIANWKRLLEAERGV